MTDIPTASVESALLLAEGLARYRANGWPTEEIGGTSPRAAAIICALASEVRVTRHELALARRSRPRGFVVVHMRSPDDDDEGRPWCRTSDREVPDVPADDVTCRACFRRLNKAQKPPAARAHPPGSRNPERDAKITQLVAEGRKLDEVGAMLGLTRERVRQIAKRGGAPPPLDRIRRAATERATAAAEADLERRTRECVICRRSFVSMYNRTACDNEDCRWLHRQGGRYYLDPGFREAHRVSQAKTVLRHPERHKASAVALAERVVAGTAPPNRRYIGRSSKVSAVLRRVGRDDLLPASTRPEPIKAPYGCPATNLNGTACSRRVWTEGDLCHIHAGQAARRREQP